jgi:hypothetical protein
VEYGLIASGVLGKEYGSVSPRGNEPSLFDGQEWLELALPGEGFELYWHMNADRMRTRGWHGYYWARRTEEGGHEIRSVPSTSGEHSAPGGIFPKEGFEQHYKKVNP